MKEKEIKILKKNNYITNFPSYTSKRAITLVALVITIIVMLILTGVTISLAINGRLFNYSGKVVGDTKNEINNEQDLAGGKISVDGKSYNSIDDYLAGNEIRLSYDETQKDKNRSINSKRNIYR